MGTKYKSLNRSSTEEPPPSTSPSSAHSVNMSYGPAVRLVGSGNGTRQATTANGHRKWAPPLPTRQSYNQCYQSSRLMSRAHHICLCLVPFPLRRLLTRAFRVSAFFHYPFFFHLLSLSFFSHFLQFIFLVILMVTVLINILFIIDTRARLQQQQLQLQQRQTSSENGKEKTRESEKVH